MVHLLFCFALVGAAGTIFGPLVLCWWVRLSLWLDPSSGPSKKQAELVRRGRRRPELFFAGISLMAVAAWMICR